MRARGGDDDAADQRAGGPRDVLHGLEERVALLEVALVDEVRQRGVHRRAEDRVAEAAQAREHDDPDGPVHERQCDEDERAHPVRRDHQATPLEPVEERADDEADDDRREEDRDEERGDPRARVRAVVDLDRQRNGREPGAQEGAEGREEEQPEAGVTAEELEMTHEIPEPNRVV